MTKHGLGRIVHEDKRDREYLLRSLPVMAGVRPRKKTWELAMGDRFDQGSKPHCVGFAWKHFLRSRPKVRGAKIDPAVIYAEAQKMDGIPGENYDGTTVRGGAVYLKKSLGIVSTYRWAFTLEDALNGVGLVGPLVLGTNWYQGMERPAVESGVIHPTGSYLGGHAYLLIGYSDATERAVIQNSWGLKWGISGGRAVLPYDDLELLLGDGGEACIATEA